MKDRIIFAGAVAACLVAGAAIAGTGTALPVQQAPEQSPPIAPAVPEQQSDSAPVPDEVLAPDAGDAARAAHLDQLFGRLAEKNNPDWEAVQRQIWAAWNRTGSDSMDFLAQRADQAMAAEQYTAALVYLNDLVRLAPDFAEGWNKRATLHFLTDEYGKSLDDIAQVLRREPRHFGALSGLGIILDRIGDQAGALEAYRRAVAIHPNLPGANEGIKKLEKEVEGRRL
ncbi:MAG: tetratricopeptide repeat protein [Pseudomonadota bacterium]